MPRQSSSPVRHDTAEPEAASLTERAGALVSRVLSSRPVRVVQHYAGKRGPILASGLAFQAIFAVFAALWIGFAIAGLVIATNIGLRDSLIDVLAQTVPGLITTDSQQGIVDPEDLLAASVGAFSWQGAIAAVVLLLAALNWLASAREAVRSIFDLPILEQNVVLLKLKDLGLAIGFGALLVLSAVLSVVSTLAFDAVLEWIGIRDSTTSTIVGRLITLGVMFLLDAVVLAALYRVLAGVRIPLRRLRQGALIGAVALGGLKVLGNSLLGGASNNPLIASFAVFIGLLIWFNLVCQVLLAAAAWVAVGIKDDRIVLDEDYLATRLQQARELLDYYDPEPEDPPGFWTRLKRRVTGS
ncbi:MAG: YihY/virulence factor BrkB family protein [Microcella sp.]|uniref:YihY/virulence factor BrkB family protein n=1 Tax=Microcella sp. TaxID=1913979 RepID=UPI003314F5AF